MAVLIYALESAWYAGVLIANESSEWIRRSSGLPLRTEYQMTPGVGLREAARGGLLIVILAMSTGCGLWTIVFGDPEGASGPDAYRHQAGQLSLDEVLTDSVSNPEGDRTDWYQFEIYDAGRLAIELSADEQEAEVSLAVFDRYGVELQAFERTGGELATLAVDVARGGRYFLRMQAVSGPTTAYDIKVSVGAPVKHTTNPNAPAGRPDF